MKKAKSDRRTIDKVFVLLGAAVAVVMLVIGGLSWKAYSFAKSSVTTELSAQKIYFPAKDSAAFNALPAADQTAMGKYSGQQLLTGDQAKVYANNFIGVHLSKIAGGKTYAEISTEALADPTNAQLKQQQQTLFQGETLRGLLLGDGYAYWTFGQIAKFAALAAFAGTAVMIVLVGLGVRHMTKLS
ncbi:MAG TPA: hypothetical protein VLG11_02265 [Candidatus Saccharimonadales bacterium]|nr:hypothetical protein [Candidatus Saccharimonadales bacterium]